MPFNASKLVIDRIQLLAPTIQELIIVRDSTPIDLTIPFKPSVLTSSPIYNEDTRSANAALLTELTTCNTLSTPARTYAHCVVRREERPAVRNVIRDGVYHEWLAIGDLERIPKFRIY
jgi:hypothetical protein